MMTAAEAAEIKDFLLRTSRRLTINIDDAEARPPTKPPMNLLPAAPRIAAVPPESLFTP